MNEHKAPSIEAARKMGEDGGPAVEEERLAFEAWMSGHCWVLGATWHAGEGYVGQEEIFGLQISQQATETRRLWAAWRDRAAFSTGNRATGEALEKITHKVNPPQERRLLRQRRGSEFTVWPKNHERRHWLRRWEDGEFEEVPATGSHSEPQVPDRRTGLPDRRWTKNREMLRQAAGLRSLLAPTRPMRRSTDKW